MQEHARKSSFLASQPAAGNAAVVPNFTSKSAFRRRILRLLMTLKSTPVTPVYTTFHYLSPSLSLSPVARDLQSLAESSVRV